MTITLFTSVWFILAGIAALQNLPKARTRIEGVSIFVMSFLIPPIMIALHRLEQVIDKHKK
jgi:hypothetical protein